MGTHWVATQRSGRLGITDRPRGGDWMVDEVLAWKAIGVDLVVSLLTPEEVLEFGLEAEEDRCYSHGIRFRLFPVSDRGTPSSREAFLEFAADLSRAVGRGETVAIHCRQGVGRSALVAASVLVLLGEEP